MDKAWKLASAGIFAFLAFVVLGNLTLARAWKGTTSLIDHNGNQTLQWSDGEGHRVKIHTEGKVELNEDWTDLARLGSGAEMNVEEEANGVTRRLDVKAGSDGRPVYAWKVDGKERAFDAEGREWLRSMLLQFVRGSGYAADARVASILKKQGPDGVLAEITRIPGDYVKRIYFEKLFEHRDLPAPAVEKALRQAGSEVKSDYELRQALTAASASHNLAEPAALAYAEATRNIESDYEQRQALSELIAKERPSPRALAAVLQSAQGIASDYELAELLTGVADSALGDPTAQRAYLDAVGSIGSDYEHHRALSAAVQSGKLAQDAVVTVIRSAQGIKSDYERSSLLVEIAGKYDLNGPARDAYQSAAGTIHSEYERKRAQEALGGSGR